MFPPRLGVPLPRSSARTCNPLTFALVQLFLTIPVLVAGGRFFRVGMKTLFKGAPNMDTLVAIGTGSAFLLRRIRNRVDLSGKTRTLCAAPLF